MGVPFFSVHSFVLSKCMAHLMYKHADNRLLGLSELFFFLWDVCMKSVGVMAIVTAMHAWWWVVWLLCEWHSFIRYDMTTLFPLMFVLVWSKPDARWMFFVVLLFAITYQRISLTNTWVMLVAFCHGKFLCGLNKIVHEEWTASGWDFFCISPGLMFHSWWPMPVELERFSWWQMLCTYYLSSVSTVDKFPRDLARSCIVRKEVIFCQLWWGWDHSRPNNDILHIHHQEIETRLWLQSFAAKRVIRLRQDISGTGWGVSHPMYRKEKQKK